MDEFELNIYDSSDDEEDSSYEYKTDKEESLPWIEKYRPDNLNELVSHKEIIKSLRLFIKNKSMPHMLFYGPPGTGKTSTILACAKELYGHNFSFMVMELNASDDRGIEVVRNKIKQFVTSDNSFCRMNDGNNDTDTFKLVILDETDAMTDDAQSILRQVVEKCTKNARFCLICNYIKKINPSLQSRCISFRFTPLDKKSMNKRIKYIIKKENINIDKNGIETIINRSNGDMRRVLNTLQSISMIYDKIDSNCIDECFGYPKQEDMCKIMTTLLKDNIKTGYDIISNICKINGTSLTDIIVEINKIIMDAIIDEKYYISELEEIDIFKLGQILDTIRLLEVNQANNANESIQISSLISIFKL